jgi:hypothetical protein
LCIALGSAKADVLAEITRCSRIADAAERLACFDRVAPSAAQATAPKTEDFGKPAARVPEVSELTASVRELGRTVRGKALFVLDNGQTWRQLDGDSAQVLEPLPGEALKVTIARGLFDSYNLTIEGRNALVKVRRIR